ncbi:sulfur carrier protein ThiS [Reinekea sp.]|jgi:thiamine biosynthesis protein ThiS|uniref:sulfur carrier protein ThiS n=1 Tax=Reinekea sp. TaxID=1970455 RepID=UPI0039894585
MTIFINGECHPLVSNNLLDILNQHNFKSPYAIAINKVFVPNHQYSTTRLEVGDALDVVSPIQGG